MVQRSGVLIETYWNVKADKTGLSPAFCKCINRNILECKEDLIGKFRSNRKVLIETYWNVKKYTQTADLGYIPY